jgi:hypothetical protein
LVSAALLVPFVVLFSVLNIIEPLGIYWLFALGIAAGAVWVGLLIRLTVDVNAGRQGASPPMLAEIAAFAGVTVFGIIYLPILWFSVTG